MHKPTKSYRGISRKHHVNISRRRDDVRTFGQKLADLASTESGTFRIFGTILAASLLLIWMPFVPEILFLVAVGFLFRFYRFNRRHWRMPFRVPAYLSKWMPRPVLDSSTANTGSANLYFGMDNETGEETWGSTTDVNKHVLILGTTGSGKTETIMASVAGFLALGSGVMIVDGKASANTFDSVYTLMRFLGRDPDLFVIDYLTGGKDMAGPQKDRRSHSYNPLAFGGATQKAEIMVSLMDSGGGGGESSMWTGRAISFVEALVPPLSFLAERGHVLLNPSLLAEYFSLEVLENLLSFGVIVDLNHNIVDLPVEFPAEWKELQKRLKALRLYLTNLPSWESGRSLVPHLTSQMQHPDREKINKERLGVISKRHRARAEELELKDGDPAARVDIDKQHGFITMQLVRAVGNLSENYGFIYNAEISEISFWDVVLNRRGLVILLPAMERSPENLEQLGKMTVLSLKSVLGALLNTRAEGSRREIIDGNPSNARVPYMATLDEVGSYIVKGLSVIPSQARSLGVSVWFGTQTVSDLMKADANEGKAIIENTALKMIGRLSGPADSETAKLALELGGKASVQMADQMTYQKHALGLDTSLRVAAGSSLREEYRVDFQDLAQQENGEVHMMIGAKEIDQSDMERGEVRLVRMLSFYTGGTERIKTWRRNPYCAVKPPSRADAQRMGRSEEVQKRIAQAIDDIRTGANDSIGARSIKQSLRIVDQGPLGRFLSWRRAEIAAGAWDGLSREERDKRIRAWWDRHAEAADEEHKVVMAVQEMQAAERKMGQVIADMPPIMKDMMKGMARSWLNTRVDRQLVELSRKVGLKRMEDYPGIVIRNGDTPILGERARLHFETGDASPRPVPLAKAREAEVRDVVHAAEDLIERAS